MKVTFDSDELRAMVAKGNPKNADVTFRLAGHGIRVTTQAVGQWLRERDPYVPAAIYLLALVMEYGSKKERVAAKVLWKRFFREFREED